MRLAGGGQSIHHKALWHVPRGKMATDDDDDDDDDDVEDDDDDVDDDD